MTLTTYHNKTKKLKKGDCVFINCADDYVHKTSQDLWSLKWIHFNGENLPRIYKMYIDRGGTNVIHTSQIQELELVIDDILSIAQSKDCIKDMEINSKLVYLTTIIMRNSIKMETPKNQKGERVEKVKDYLNNSYSNNILLDDLAKTFYINKYYLSRLFKSTYGTTIEKYILQLRINKSKELLRFTNLSISKISQEIGFHDQNYFSRVFKSFEGITPTTYKKLWETQ